MTVEEDQEVGDLLLYETKVLDHAEYSNPSKLTCMPQTRHASIMS